MINKKMSALTANTLLCTALLVSTVPAYAASNSEAVKIQPDELRKVENNFLINPEGGKSERPTVEVSGTVKPVEISQPSPADANGSSVLKRDYVEHYPYYNFKEGYGARTFLIDKATMKDKKVTVTYKNQATYKGQPIDIRITYSDFVYEKNPKSDYDEGLLHISDNLFSGYVYNNMTGLTIDIELFDQSGKAIEANNDIYYTFNSLNGYKGNPNASAERQKEDGGEFVGYINHSEGSEIYITQDSNIVKGTYQNVEGFRGDSNDFTDKIGGETFKKNTVSFQVSGTKPSFRVGSTNRWSAWNSMSSSTLFNVAPQDPKKTVSDADEKDVTKNDYEIDEQLTYHISQKTHTLGVDALQRYKQFDIVDNLPKNADYVADSARLLDSDGKPVESPGQFVYAEDTHTLMFTASQDFLDKMMMDGRSYILEFKADPQDSVKQGDVVENTAKSIIDGHEYQTNQTLSTTKAPTLTKIDKSIIAADGKLVNELDIESGQNYKYHVDAFVTNDPSVKSLVLMDDLVDELKVNSAKVLDESGNDITDQGDLAIDEGKEIVTWTAKNAGALTGKKLVLEIDTAVKSEADLTKYLKDGVYNLPNTAQIIINDKPMDSDTVNVKVPKKPTETTIDKSVLEDDGKAVDSRNVELGKDYRYNVDTVITDSKEITKLVLSDDLEDVLDLKSAKVLNAEGKDITNQGDLAIDEEKEVIIWTAKDAKAYAGQTLKLVIDSQVKADADLKDYTADGKTVIPNTAKVTVDDKSTDSDKVDVIVPMKKVPTTEEPTTEEPTTEAPATEEPTTEAPTTEVPTTEQPTTEESTTEAPTTEAPTTETPTTEQPKNTVDPVTVENPKNDDIKKPSNVSHPILPDTGNEGMNYLLNYGLPLVLMGGIGLYLLKRRENNQM
ncbi:isopeptide-forming domain-containing fimbrial protein [Macrococcus bovicus]|uniref:isopeptide-forming domain-containing fimbrial protein n=1 Tax=Macrococcus bovicus TaxID=69968 RepID=UPI0025A684FB|nr:isopeptide-forming domain-containing fimbrial protein [Macrococcus bovicus]WJP96721.1 isopeptide-forming domain-containing fimbrial protein [Macrococcus bovicus]